MKTALWHGAKDSISVGVAIALFGFVFGVLAHLIGMNTLLAALMSTIVYAGAAQMVSLKVWSAHQLPTLSLIATAFIVCLRYVLMGTTMRPIYEGVSKKFAYFSLFFMIDESWALTLLKRRRGDFSGKYLAAYLVGSGGLFYLTWLVGTIMGGYLAVYVQHPERYGFDFAFTAVFLALLVGMWRSKRDIVPWSVAFVVAVLAAKFIPGTWYIVLGAIAGSLVGVWRDYH